MATGDLVTLAQAEQWLGVSSDTNGVIAAIISAVSTSIQQYVSYNFASQDYDRSFDGLGTEHLMLPDRPVTAISLVQIDGHTIPAASGSSWKGYVFSDRRISLRGYKFIRGSQNVRIQYTAGYDQIPADVQTATLMWVKAIYDAKDYGANVESYEAGDTKVAFTQSTPVGGGFMTAMPPVVNLMLSQYCRTAMF